MSFELEEYRDYDEDISAQTEKWTCMTMMFSKSMPMKKVLGNHPLITEQPYGGSEDKSMILNP
jgi:hypothetical protein